MSEQRQEGIVELFEPSTLIRSPEGNVTWWAFKLEGRAYQIFVHNNRIREIGELKKGDKIYFQETANGPYGKDGRVYASKIERSVGELTK